MPACRSKGCSRPQEVGSSSGLCPVCQGVAQASQATQPSNASTPSTLSFPPIAMAASKPVNMESVNKVAAQIESGEEVDPKECMVTMFTMMASILQGSSKLEEKIERVNKKTEDNETRIEALEKKVGEKDECAIPLSIVMTNVKKYPSHPDIVVAKKVIEEIKAEGVNPEIDVVKAVRLGYKPATATQPERLGAIMVELRNEEVRAKIMKSKKALENVEGEVSKIIIKNMKTQAEVKQDRVNRQMLRMLPGGQQFFISGNGSFRPQTRPSRPPGPPGPLQGPHFAFQGPSNPLAPRGMPPRPFEPPAAPRVAMPGLHPAAPGLFQQPPPHTAPDHNNQQGMFMEQSNH